MNLLNRERIDHLMHENHELPETHSKKQARAEALRKRQAGWSPKSRKIGLAQIRDPRGMPIVNPAHGADALRIHWQGIFSEVAVEEE
eukprot:8614080-Pyramimonas_sp.AAC.1